MSIKDDFVQHALLFLITLAVVLIGTALHAPSTVLAPISQGLGLGLPAILAGHAMASSVRSWRKDDSDSKDSAEAQK